MGTTLCITKTIVSYKKWQYDILFMHFFFQFYIAKISVKVNHTKKVMNNIEEMSEKFKSAIYRKYMLT